MPNSLFTFPKRLPDVPRDIAMYRTATQAVLSRKAAANADFAHRVKLYSMLFKTSTPVQEFGSFVLFREAEHSLELFRLSHSLRWTHNTLAHRESAPKAALPAEKEVQKLAAKALQDYQIDSANAKFQSIAYSQVVVATAPGGKKAVRNTEAHAIYGFSLDGIPVVGPGAKLRASFVEEGQMSQLLHFWRQPAKGKAVRIKTPQQALERFAQDPRFMRLSAETAVVDIQDIEFNYYALSPSDFQQYLIPVYSVKGTVKTTAFPRYDFTHRIVAVDLSPEQIKGLAAVANPGSCAVF